MKTASLTQEAKLQLVRRYSDGQLSLRDLRDRGLMRTTEVFAILADQGRRPPVAAMDGPNVASRRAGMAKLAASLRGE